VKAVFSFWSFHGLYSSDVSRQEYGTVPAGSYQIVSDGKECHKSRLQSWSRGLQRNRRNSVVVSCKGYTL
jgi:hypothetical protein